MRESAEAHLAGCEACRRAYLSERSLRDRCARLAVEEAPAELRERIRTACREAGGSPAAAALPIADRRGRRRLLRTWALTFAAAAAAMAAIVLLTLPRVRVRTAFAAEHVRIVSGEVRLTIEGGAAPDFNDRFCRALGYAGALPDLGRKKVRGGRVLRLSGRRVGVIVCYCSGRKIDVTYFIAHTGDLNLAGMRPVEMKEQTFHVASGGECGQRGCQVVAWHAGGWTYALACKSTEEIALEYAGRSAGVLPRKE